MRSKIAIWFILTAWAASDGELARRFLALQPEFLAEHLSR